MSDPVVILETEEIIVDVGGIIDAIRVVAVFNPTFRELVVNWLQYAPDIPHVRGKVADAVSLGSGVYEALDRASPGLATAIHDFVYMVSHSHESITSRDVACEAVAKSILDL